MAKSARILNHQNGGYNDEPYIEIKGEATAKVNGIDNVGLGLPIGSITMWAGNVNESDYSGLPKNWFLCDGSTIDLYDADKPTTNVDWEPSFTKVRRQTIQGIDIKKDSIQGLIDCIGEYYSDHEIYYIVNYNGTNKYLNKGFFDTHYQDIYFLGDSYYSFQSPLDRSKLLLACSNIDQYAQQGVFTPIDFDGHLLIKLPDLRQRFPLGAKDDSDWKCGEQHYNTTLGSTGGQKEHLLTYDESGLPAHTHEIQKGDTGGGGDFMSSIPGDSGNSNRAIKDNITQNAQKAHNNIPPYLAVNFIIKYA